METDGHAMTRDMSASTIVGEDATDRTLRRRPWRRRVTPWAAIVEHQYKGSGTARDPYVVTFLENDAEDALQYGTSYKWAITLFAASGTLSVTMGSSVLSGAIGSIKASFPGLNNMIYILITGIYILGFAIGPFLWAPGSEVFGRRKIYIWTLIPLTIFDAAACASQNMTTLLMMRLLAGTFGCSTMTNAGGIISDMFEAKDRGLAMGVFGAMPWLGPAVGPIIGGFLSEAAGWRWVAAVVALYAGFEAVLHLLGLPETYAPVLLRDRATKLTLATGKEYRSEHDVAKPFDTRTLVKNQLKVPFVLLFCEPVVLVLSLYMACIFAILYIQFTSFPLVFQGQRHWSPGVAALPFLGMYVGTNLALLYMTFWGNPAYARALKEKRFLPPEARLPSGIVGAFMIPVGLMIFAWTCVPTSIHWIVPILATVPFGAGMVLLFLALMNYLVDAYLPTAASVMAGSTVLRSVVGVVIPLFTVDIYDALGINWASALVAFLAVVFAPFPIFLYLYGQRIRRLTKYGREADDHGLELANGSSAADAERKLDITVDEVHPHELRRVRTAEDRSTMRPVERVMSLL